MKVAGMLIERGGDLTAQNKASREGGLEVADIMLIERGGEFVSEIHLERAQVPEC